jgi:hypothetical protein
MGRSRRAGRRNRERAQAAKSRRRSHELVSAATIFQRLQDELAGIGHQAGIEVDDASVSDLEQPSSLRPL